MSTLNDLARLGFSLLVAAVSIVAVIGLNSPSVAGNTAVDRKQVSTPRIAWESCDDPDFGGMECGTLRVPIDASDPQLGMTELSLVRRQADDKTQRIGTLLLNNGPGSSSIEQFRYALRSGLVEMGGSFTTRFDIVAVDPRGVGHSSPLRCDLPLKGRGITHFPTTEAQFNALMAHNQAFTANCREVNGPLMEHVDMTSTARDFEQVRIALGERQLTWYGIAYSNLLGRTYAQLYPGRLRAMVFDTALNDRLPAVERLADEMKAAEDSFVRFAGWCSTSDSCALHGQDVAAVYDQLVERANKNPIPIGTTGRVMSGEDIQAATQGHLVMKLVTWTRFADGLKEALDGDATILSIDPDKTLDLVQARLQACLDTPPAATTWEQFAELKTMAEQLSPHLGGAVQSWTNMAGCLGWPNKTEVIEATTLVTGAPPALILQSTNESLAAYHSGFGLASQLPGSRVVTYVGDDYTMYLISDCIREHVDHYLVDDTLPAPGALCTH